MHALLAWRLFIKDADDGVHQPLEVHLQYWHTANVDPLNDGIEEPRHSLKYTATAVNSTSQMQEASRRHAVVHGQAPHLLIAVFFHALYHVIHSRIHEVLALIR